MGGQRIMIMSASVDNLAPGLVRFQPASQSIDLIEGETLLECARRAAVPLSSSCGGSGTCRSCMIRIVAGRLPAPSEADQRIFSIKSLSAGWRRACQVWLQDGCTVHVPKKSAGIHTVRKLDNGDVRIVPDPSVKSWKVDLSELNTSDSTGRDERLIELINKRRAGRCRAVDSAALQALNELPDGQRGELLAAIRLGELIDIKPSRRRVLGLAVDLGTTSIGGYLLDLRKGKACASEGITNPQLTLGGDVVTRINAAVRNPGQSQELQQLAISGINRLARTLCAEAGADTGDIADVVVAGNSPMQHILLGFPLGGLARAPFTPHRSGPVDLKVRELGIDVAPGAYLHAFPGIAGFVGGDHVAALLALEARGQEGATLLLDIGTNTEISLLLGGDILTVSCPSGPALEGGEITWGMQAAPGAIEGCDIHDDVLNLRTIDAAPAEGICGSGVLDIMAALYKCGAINHRGRLQIRHARVRDTDEEREFVLVDEDDRDAPAIVFTQSDVRAVQLAKAAIRTGIDMLLTTAGIDAHGLERVAVAGAFGSYISIKSAIDIGMLPALPLDSFEQIGDAAGLGARLATLSQPYRARAVQIARHARHVEMAGTRAFQQLFMRRINLDRPANQQ
jgi:uncharacterized 2Fe-2S/4Fe-4S cluster protein (DUF4445 family)